ncbi:SAM-dependent methyltransferase [Micromonospora sp. SH-82]|uniref:SAM-dependent methyltransferase n=1 Tax=Micromonospora sp. SH-82 TaxID=3132938 RepID=UPI003EB9B24B
MIDELTFADWLRLREDADAAARAVELVDPVRRRLTGPGPHVIHDLGTGTGSMGRWLAPQLPGPQHWVMYDRDDDLLARATAGMAAVAAVDGGAVTAETRRTDITRLTPADLSGAALVTASALLDMLTEAEAQRMVDACAGAGCPALFMVSVVGRVRFAPADPLDAEFTEAFNAHQRRTTEGRALLGPDAVEAVVDAFGRHGVPVQVRSSPWRLGAEDSALALHWLAGWLEAAVETRPELAEAAVGYARRRRSEAAEGRLHVEVDHTDLLAGCG